MAYGLRITVGNKQAGSQLRRSTQRYADAVVEAMRTTADEAAELIEREGRADISAAGNFGTRWTEGWQANVGEGGGNIRIRVTMAVPYWTVFQEGKVIQGQPMLWIPLSFAADAKGVRARDYPGMLFRVDRKSGGAPLLMAAGGQAKYFGKESVTIPKKFHLLEIVNDVAKELRHMYRENFNKAKG
jgi:hypothetical protein